MGKQRARAEVMIDAVMRRVEGDADDAARAVP